LNENGLIFLDLKNVRKIEELQKRYKEIDANQQVTWSQFVKNIQHAF